MNKIRSAFAFLILFYGVMRIFMTDKKEILQGNKHEQNPRPIFLVSGLSGAGKSTALQVFEDMNFFTADGLPPSLIHAFTRLAQEPDMQHFKGIALGLDMRFDMGYFEYCTTCFGKNSFKQLTHGVSTTAHLIQDDTSEQKEDAYCNIRSKNCAFAMEKIFQDRKSMDIVNPLPSYTIVFLDANNHSIIKRYGSTRRPHPLEIEGLSLENAITKERQNLHTIKQNADIVLDTSNFTLHDLRRAIQHRFSDTYKNILADMHIHIMSFGFKYGLPQVADMVFDVRVLPNPYFVDELRAFSGLESCIVDYVFEKEESKRFRDQLLEHLSFILPYYSKEGRYKICIAVGCTGGRHRSVALVQFLCEELKQKYTVSVEHKHLRNDMY